MTSAAVPRSLTRWVVRRVDVPLLFLIAIVLAWLGGILPLVFDPSFWAMANRSTLLVSFLAIAAGEMARIRLVGEREAAPMAAACAFAFAFYTQVPSGNPVVYNDRVVFSIAGLAMVTGAFGLALRGRAVRLDELAVRLMSIGVAGWVFRDLPIVGGVPLAEWFGNHPDQGYLAALVMMVVSGFALAVHAATMGLHNAARNLSPVLPSIVAEGRALIGLSTAMSATGALIAVAAVPLGLWAIPLFLIPLVLTLFAVGQHTAVRDTQRETIRALSRLPELAGNTITGHAARVADLALAVGLDLGMSDSELRDLEYAALLHDLGQVCLTDPIPGGATVMAAPSDQRQISADSAAILRRAGVLPEVAVTLLTQSTQYRQVREFDEEIPLAGRIIKVVNAYDDFVHLLSAPDRSAAAIERIHLGLGYEYDPRVVDAVVTVVRRRGSHRSPAPHRQV